MSNEIEGRIDPYYHKPSFSQFRSKLSKIKDIVRIGDLINEWNRGDGPRTGFYTEDKINGVYFLRVNNLKKHSVDLTDVKFISRIVHEKTLKRAKVTSGDLVFAISGTKDNLGTVSIIPENIKEANLNSAIVKLVLDENRINKKYFCYFFDLNSTRIQIDYIGKGAAQNNLNNDEISEIQIPLPSLESQNKIVQLMDKAYSQKKEKETKAQKFLDSINDYVLDELGIKLPEVKDKMCFVVYSDEVSGKRIDAYYYQPKFEEMEKAVNVGKFEVKELKEFITKIHYGASVKNEYVDEGIPLLRILNLKPNKFDLKKVVNLPETMIKDLGNAFVNEGDLLISRSGTVGLVSVVPKEANGFAFGSFMIKFCLNEKVNKNYISVWLNTKLQNLFIEREKIGAIQGNITIGTIGDFKIPLPPVSVQNKIAVEVKERMRRAEGLRREAGEGLEKAKGEVERIILGD